MPTLLSPLGLGALEVPNGILVAPLNAPDQSTFCSGGAKGCADYPAPAAAAG